MVETADATHPVSDQPAAAERSSSALRGRLTVALLLTLGAGFLLGRVDTATAAGFYGALAGLGLLAGFGVRGVARRIAGPYLAFADQLDGLTLSQRRTALRELPTDRDDEIGRMASAVSELMRHRIRDHHDAGQLRRTLDDRVTRATRRAVRELEQIAMRDPLTDLGNRRFLDDQLPPLIEASLASGTDLLCVLVDMDNFKPVNDTLGHAAGDQLLQLLAELLQHACRDEDLAIRLGGDEFALFLPGADLDRADRLTDRLRQQYRRRAATLLRKAVDVDLSVGVASMLVEGCRDGQALLDRADAYLYRAKRRGKGQTVTHRQAAKADAAAEAQGRARDRGVMSGSGSVSVLIACRIVEAAVCDRRLNLAAGGLSPRGGVFLNWSA